MSARGESVTVAPVAACNVTSATANTAAAATTFAAAAATAVPTASTPPTGPVRRELRLRG